VPHFAYEAASPGGAIVRGVIDAPTRSAAVERILAQGRTPTRVVEQATAGPETTNERRSLLPAWGMATDRLTLLRELSLLLRAGLSVERALVALQGMTKRSRVKHVLQALLDALRGGDALSSAMRRAEDMFPETTRKLVAAGEASGKLADVMTRLAQTAERTAQLRERVVSALIYPALLVVVMFAVLVVIFTVVLPRLEPLFAQSGAALPWPTAVLLAVAGFFNAYGTAVTVVLVALLVLGLYAVRQPEMQMRLDRFATRTRVLLEIPQNYAAAQFCRNLGMLLDGGLPLNRALESAEAAIANRHMRREAAKVSDAVRQGRPLRGALESAAVFPRLTVEFAAVGEETGRLGAMLNEAAEILDNDVRTKLDRLSALLLPVVTIVLGAIVAAIMTGVVSGILSANDLAL
jgi:general secretion pathway protein F